MLIKDFRDLNVWKNGKELVLEIYSVTANFPKQEMFGLVSQMRRAAVSVPSNIAEGFNRSHKKEYKRFLNMALGSIAELETQTEIAFELEYLNNERKNMILEKLDHEARMLRNLINRITQSIT